MNVKVLGFSWRAPDLYTPGQFRADLASHPDDEHTYRGRSYLLKVNDGPDDDPYARGILIVARNQRSIVELIRDEGGARKIQVRPLAEDTSLMEFNFFLLNKTTHRGLYLTYHHSVSVSTFTNLVEHIYGKLKQGRRDAAIAAVPEGRGAATRIKALRSTYHSARLDASVLYRLEDLAALLQELDSIQSVVLKVSTVDVSEPWFTPLEAEARTMSH